VEDIEVLCIGHAAYDLFLPLEGFPEENRKYSLEETLESAGGPACNAASLLGLWGAGCAFAGIVGDDPNGKRVLEDLSSAGVDTRLVALREGFSTPLSVILTNTNSGTRTILNRKKSGFALDTLSFVEAASKAGWRPRILLFDGHELDASLAAMDLFPGAVTILDAGSFRKGTEVLSARVDYLVASERFGREATGAGDLREEAELERCLSGLSGMSRGIVALTLGERGCVYKARGNSGRVEALKARAVDTTAAGDIFHGAFAYGLLRGKTFIGSLGLATAAAGLSVERPGGRASIPSRDEAETTLERLLSSREDSGHNSGMTLKIEIGKNAFIADLYAGKTVDAFVAALPVDVRLSRWGEEYYGSIGVDLPDDPKARDLMEVGELAYWAPGQAFCIFFGRTPASTDSRPRAASEVFPLGKIKGDTQALKGLGSSVSCKLSVG
jgi:sulfofructose kinase